MKLNLIFVYIAQTKFQPMNAINTYAQFLHNYWHVFQAQGHHPCGGRLQCGPSVPETRPSGCGSGLQGELAF